MESNLVVESVHQMPVSIHGDCDRAVSQSGLDCLGMLPVCDQPRGMGVTQIVDSTRWSDGCGDGFAPDAPERAAAEQRSLFGGPHHVVDGRVRLEMPREDLDNEAGE